jgi:2-haloacid dehalogenase
MPSPKNVVFDCVGTLVDYTAFTTALQSRLGRQLSSAGIPAPLLTMAWIETAEREYTYLSLSNRYTSFNDLFSKLFTRVLHYAGVSHPHEFCTEEDREFLVDAWTKLTLREGARECIQKLRDAGFTVWGFTAGDVKRVGGYFAQGGVDLPGENLLSCDTTGVAKPIPEAYKPVLERMREESGGRQAWFAAAHLWDVSAARGVG